MEKWKEAYDQHGFAGDTLIELPKAFDTINQELPRLL